jgi:hypothetical protein
MCSDTELPVKSHQNPKPQVENLHQRLNCIWHDLIHKIWTAEPKMKWTSGLSSSNSNIYSEAISFDTLRAFVGGRMEPRLNLRLVAGDSKENVAPPLSWKRWSIDRSKHHSGREVVAVNWCGCGRADGRSRQFWCGSAEMAKNHALQGFLFECQCFLFKSSSCFFVRCPHWIESEKRTSWRRWPMTCVFCALTHSTYKGTNCGMPSRQIFSEAIDKVV